MQILENKYITVGIIAALCFIIIALSGISLYLYNREPNCAIDSLVLTKDIQTDTEEKAEDTPEVIHVEIKGAVKNPGVYEAKNDEIINDIIAKAGGLNNDAYTDNINLSKKVSDELVIYVYTKDEIEDDSSKKATNNSTSSENSYNIETYTEGKVSIISSNDTQTNQENSTTLININTADAAKLEELPGIGATKANSIIAYREEVGGFKSIEDLKNVSGIGDATFENLKIILRCNIIFLTMFIFIFIYCLITTKVIQYESIYNGDKTSITGKIISYSINGNKLKINIKDQEEIIATYYIETQEELTYLKENIGIGKTITVNGSLNRPLNNTIPNTFNYKKYLYNNKIYYLFDAHSYSIKNDNNLLEKAKDYLIKRAYNSKNSEYLLVLVLGDKALISSDEYNTYQNNGTSHLLAVSGSHITVILLVLSFFLKKSKEVPKLIIISLILLFFAFVTNNAPAVNRAIYFFIINRINKLGNLKLSNIQVLFITAFILLLLEPFTLYDLGFIYSFCISLGIMYYSDKLNGNIFIVTLKVSIIAFLFSYQ